MTDNIEISKEQSDSKITGAIIAAFVCVWIFSTVPILIRLSENEISPNTTMFNRCWIAAIIFSVAQELSLLHQRWLGQQSIFKQSLDSKQILLLFPTASFFCSHQVLWAWSLTQTSVANSTLLHSLTPLFATLGGYLLFGQYFDNKNYEGSPNEKFSQSFCSVLLCERIPVL